MRRLNQWDDLAAEAQRTRRLPGQLDRARRRVRQLEAQCRRAGIRIEEAAHV